MKYDYYGFLSMKDKLDDFICFHYKDGKTESYSLNENEMAVLRTFLKAVFAPSTKKCDSISSYSLKHVAEHFLGFYVSNADLKRAMVDLGFSAFVYNGSPNWVFYMVKRKINWFNLDNQQPMFVFLQRYTDFLLKGESHFKELRPNG